MSDFDEVLELLLTDPSFQARLAADPAGTLAGYDLDAAEVDLLRQQVSGDSGASTAIVEDRVTKSSTFGLFGSLGIGGVGDTVGGAVARQGLSSVPTDGPGGLGEWSRFGVAAGAAVQAAVEQPATEGLGSAPAGWGGGGEVASRSGFGSAPAAVSGLGDAPRSGLGDRGDATLPAPRGYHNQVDADGDGRQDAATYRGRAGGGAEIRVDLNRDGRADFVGVDQDLDNRVDFADYDKDHDGVFEKRMYDDDGDGYLDRTVRR